PARTGDLRDARDELRREVRGLAGAPRRRWRPDQLLLVLVLLANGLGAAILWAVLSRPSAPAPAPVPAPAPEPVAVAAAVPDAAPPSQQQQPAAVVVAKDKPRAAPCPPPPGDPTAARVVRVGVNHLCSPSPPIKVDGAIKAAGTVTKALAACKAADPDLLAALLALERDRTLYR